MASCGWPWASVRCWPCVHPECPGALAAAAAACVPRRRVYPVLRPAPARAHAPDTTTAQRTQPHRELGALSYRVSPCRSILPIRANQTRSTSSSSLSTLVPRRGQVRFVDIPHRVQPGAQRQGARALSSTSRQRSSARRDTVAGSRSARSAAGRPAPAGCPCVRRRAPRGVPVGVAPALLAGCKHERHRRDARCAGEHREVIPPPCQAAAARHAR